MRRWGPPALLPFRPPSPAVYCQPPRARPPPRRPRPWPPSRRGSAQPPCRRPLPCRFRVVSKVVLLRAAASRCRRRAMSAGDRCPCPNTASPVGGGGTRPAAGARQPPPSVPRTEGGGRDTWLGWRLDGGDLATTARRPSPLPAARRARPAACTPTHDRPASCTPGRRLHDAAAAGGHRHCGVAVLLSHAACCRSPARRGQSATGPTTSEVAAGGGAGGGSAKHHPRTVTAPTSPSPHTQTARRGRRRAARRPGRAVAAGRHRCRHRAAAEHVR